MESRTEPLGRLATSLVRLRKKRGRFRQNPRTHGLHPALNTQARSRRDGMDAGTQTPPKQPCAPEANEFHRRIADGRGVPAV